MSEDTQQTYPIAAAQEEVDQGTPIITLDLSSPTKVISKRKPKKKVSIEAPIDEIFLESDKIGSFDSSRQVRNRSRSSPHGPRPTIRPTKNSIMVPSDLVSSSSVVTDGATTTTTTTADDSTEGSCYESDSSAPIKPSFAFSKLKVLISENGFPGTEDIDDWLSAIEKGLSASARKSDRIARLTERVNARTEKIAQLNDTVKANTQRIAELSEQVAALQKELENRDLALLEAEKRAGKVRSELESEVEKVRAQLLTSEASVAELKAEVGAKELAVAELNVELMNAKDDLERRKKVIERSEEESRMKEEVVINFEKIDQLIFTLSKSIKMYDPNDPSLGVPEMSVTDEHIRTRSKLLELKIDLAIEMSEKLNRLSIDNRVAFSKLCSENEAAARELAMLRERYYHSLFISVKQYLSANHPNILFKESDVVYDELRREALPVRDWPAWVSQNIAVKKKVFKKKKSY